MVNIERQLGMENTEKSNLSIELSGAIAEQSYLSSTIEAVYLKNITEEKEPFLLRMSTFSYFVWL